MSFDEKTKTALESYVYFLINPRNKEIFYVGKGVNDRIFDHILMKIDEDRKNLKYQTIEDIRRDGDKVELIIFRHGMTDKEAILVESCLIDFIRYTNSNLTNIQSGHNSILKGIMTIDEIKRKYNAEPLEEIPNDFLIININKTYKRNSDYDDIYQATKDTWRLDKRRVKKIKYVLSEYDGLIVEVFRVLEWFTKNRPYNKGAIKYGQFYQGWGFNGEVANDEIRKIYINKSVKHRKRKGMSNTILYSNSFNQ